ncbi:uncharacterized protein LOC111088347 [Limulus polyphemus]|uniref:Uncharacterized protein LOC111088347 n=1 Tax=Limulus polyphemus TaxID=6850 RepID=A0ABM1TDH3_LIMPO|nr:uncharacterized protein LOC111088347 [Limulus polyphemus]
MTQGKGWSPDMKIIYNRSSTTPLAGFRSGLGDTSRRTRQRILGTASNQQDLETSSGSREPSTSSYHSDNSTTSIANPYLGSGNPTRDMGRLEVSPRPQFQLPGKFARPPPSISGDSSSEFSEGESRAGSRRYYHPRKLYRMSENGKDFLITTNNFYSSEAYDSGFGPESSETSSVVSGDDLKEMNEFGKPKLKDRVEAHGHNTRETNTYSVSFNTNASTPKSAKKLKLPSTDRFGRKTTSTICHKSQSTENLYSGRYSEKLQVYRQNSSGYGRKGRRSSTDSSNCTPPISRNFSQSGDMSEIGSSLLRNSPGQFSYKPPTNVRPKVDTGSKTWAFRQRPSRKSVSPDIYCHSSGGSTTPSPNKTVIKLKTRSAESSLHCSPRKESSTKPTASKMQSLLKDIDLGTDDQFLSEMQKFIHSYREKIEKKLKEEQDDTPLTFNDNTSSTPAMIYSPDSDHPSSRGSSCIQLSPKIRPRRGSQGGSTKIPVPMWYNK